MNSRIVCSLNSERAAVDYTPCCCGLLVDGSRFEAGPGASGQANSTASLKQCLQGNLQVVQSLLSGPSIQPEDVTVSKPSRRPLQPLQGRIWCKVMICHPSAVLQPTGRSQTTEQFIHTYAKRSTAKSGPSMNPTHKSNIAFLRSAKPGFAGWQSWPSQARQQPSTNYAALVQ
jgi:hypothetical protein